MTVFDLFATFGFVGDVVSVGRHSAARIAFDVGLSGVVAILYSFVGTRSDGRWPVSLRLRSFQGC